jgi:hypothetical protein
MRKTALALAFSLIGAAGALAAPRDYRLDVTPAGTGRQAIVQVVHVPTGKVVDHADIHVREQISPPKGGLLYRDRKLRHDAEGRHLIGSGRAHLWAKVRGSGEVVHQYIVLR